MNSGFLMCLMSQRHLLYVQEKKEDKNLMYWSLQKPTTKERKYYLIKIEIILNNLKFNYRSAEFRILCYCKAEPRGPQKGKDCSQGLSEDCLGCVLQSIQEFSRDTQE